MEEKLKAFNYFMRHMSKVDCVGDSKMEVAEKLASSGQLQFSGIIDLVPILKDAHGPIGKNYRIANIEMAMDVQYEAVDPRANDSKRLSFLSKLNEQENFRAKYKALRHYGSTLGCGVQGLENVSLFQHVKSSLAFYEILQRTDDNNNPFLLIGSDISGVQEYLFDINSKGASKSLKGRSFYLQLLSDLVLKKITDECSLSEEMIIYNSGGGFYLLAPNRHDTMEGLNKAISTIFDSVFNEHKSKLFVAIDWVSFSEQEVMEGEHGNIWRRLGERIAKRKKQKLSSIILSDYNRFFEASSFLDDEQSAEDNLDKELGKHLKLSKAVSIQSKEIQASSDFSFEKPGLGYRIALHKSRVPNSAVFNDFMPNADTYLYGGNNFPAEEDGSPRTFEELVSTGYKKLGILRMDVDNLGATFISGFKHQKVTFSKYAELSNTLDRFFRGYLNTIQSEEYYRNFTFIVYSGGDDLFIVGDWKKCFELAQRIEKDFRRWTCENSMLTISAGLSIIDAKFPLLRGAEIAGQAEQDAKEFTRADGRTKNAFSVLNIPIGWEEVDELENWRKEWLKWLQKDLISKGMLYKMYSYFDIKNGTSSDSHDSTGRNRYRWQWMMAYTLSRLKDNKATTRLKDLLQDGTNNYRVLDLCCIGAKLAELELRNPKAL